MNASINILDLSLCFKQFIEEQHQDGKTPCVFRNATERERKFVELEEVKKKNNYSLGFMTK